MCTTNTVTTETALLMLMLVLLVLADSESGFLKPVWSPFTFFTLKRKK